MLSRFARSLVTVALGGEGGDEIFAGYPTYYVHKLAERYEQIPLVIRRNLIEKLVQSLPVRLSSMSFDFLAKRFVRSLQFQGLVERHQSLLGSFMRGEQEMLLTSDAKSRNGADIFGQAHHWLDLCDAQNVIEQSQFLDTKMYLADGILTKVDRASMAVSLEVRSPFLDPQVVEFAAGLSEYYKLHCQTVKFGLGRTGKYVLKKAVGHMLPPSVTQRMKKGFVPPVSGWLKGRLNVMLRDLLNEERLRREGLFEPKYVQGLISDHEKGKADNGKLLWTLMIFQMWSDNYLKNGPG
jgi:asparagine synthase (glutamine-hydrolysing)